MISFAIRSTTRLTHIKCTETRIKKSLNIQQSIGDGQNTPQPTTDKKKTRWTQSSNLTPEINFHIFQEDYCSACVETGP